MVAPLDISRTGMMGGILLRLVILWCFRSVPPFMWTVHHLGDGDGDCLTSLELGRDGAQSVGYLVAFQRYKITLYIRHVNKVFPGPSSAPLRLSSLWLVVIGTDESVSFRFTEVSNCTGLGSFLNSLTN